MPLALRYRIPANDAGPFVSHEMMPSVPYAPVAEGYGRFVRPFWDLGKIILAILAFWAIYGAGVAFDNALPYSDWPILHWKIPFDMNLQIGNETPPLAADQIPIIESAPEQRIDISDLPFTPVPDVSASVIPPPMPQQPDGIAIDAAALAASDEGQQIIAALPDAVLDATAARKRNKTDRAFNVEVNENAAEPRETKGNRHEAAKTHASAQFFLRSGDIKQAIEFEQRAVDLDPQNMSYRLSLAILFDQAGDGANAVDSYQQILRAYAARDATLPPHLDIASVRSRLGYLAGSQPTARE